MTTNPSQYTGLLTKPEDVLEPHTAKTKEEVKDAYIAELETEHERYRQLLVAQLKQQDEAKAQKKKEAQ